MDSTRTPEDLRASDAERERVVVRLRDAAAEGRLSLDETEQRQTAAYAARTRADLTPLTADLPAAQPDPAATSGVPAAGRRRLAVHAVIAAVLAVLALVGWARSPAEFFWPVWPMFWLAVSLVVHYRWRRRRWGRPVRPSATR